MILVVTIAFGNYQVGDQIADPNVMSEVLATNPQCVVQVATPIIDEQT